MASLAAVLFAGTVAAEAHPMKRATTNGRGTWIKRQVGSGPCSAWFAYVTPAMGGAQVHERTEATIACAVRIWSVPGGLDEALRIAHRESGAYAWPWARNPDVAGACQIEPVSYGSCGVFQHLVRLWAGRLRWLRHDWFSEWAWDRGISPYLMRANVLVTIRMAHASGWGPWGE